MKMYVLGNSLTNMTSIPIIVQELLQDVERFLGESLSSESLSPEIQKQRAGLLQRLELHIKRQSEFPTPVILLPQNNVNGIAGGNGNNSVAEEDYEEFPEPAAPRICSHISTTSSSGQSDEGVNVSISFAELRSSTLKYGPLWRRERLVFLEQWRKCWAGIYGHYLLMYSSERDTKPTSSVNIQGFIPRPAPDNLKDAKKKEASFEILCPGKKGYQFFARTAKDMSQWVAAICQASIQDIFDTGIDASVVLRSTARSRVDLFPDSENEHCGAVAASTLNSSENTEENYESVQHEEEEVYHDIADLLQGDSGLESNSRLDEKLLDVCPPLPMRRPVPPIPHEIESDCDSIYDDIGGPDQNNTFPNTGLENTGTLQIESNKAIPPQEMEIHGLQSVVGHEKEQIDIYDDIGVNVTLPQEIQLPVYNKKTSVGPLNGIQNLIKKMEISFSNGAIPTGGHPQRIKPDSKYSSQIQPYTQQKSVENNTEESTCSPKPPPTFSSKPSNQAQTSSSSPEINSNFSKQFQPFSNPSNLNSHSPKEIQLPSDFPELNPKSSNRVKPLPKPPNLDPKPAEQPQKYQLPKPIRSDAKELTSPPQLPPHLPDRPPQLPPRTYLKR